MQFLTVTMTKNNSNNDKNISMCFISSHA